MASRSAKRGRKALADDEAPAKEVSADEVEDSEAASDEPAVKRGRGRPRKPDHLKKRWVSSGRPRGRPRIHPLDPSKPKRPQGRPRLHPVDAENDSPKSKKVTSRGQVKRGRPKKE